MKYQVYANGRPQGKPSSKTECLRFCAYLLIDTFDSVTIEKVK